MTGIGETGGVCVIGRVDFQTGIGAVTAAALELFARSVPVAFWSVRNSRAEIGASVRLPSGRTVPVAESLDNYSVFLFTDVLWNGVADHQYLHLPSHGARIAHIAYDSDRFPPEWVTILNERFDLALFTSSYLEAVARKSGVHIPVGTLPVGLDLELLIARRFVRRSAHRIRFGSVAAFHERKGLDLLIEAFLLEFGISDDAELIVHSNLAIGDVFARSKAMIDANPGAKITLSHGHLTTEEKNNLLDSFDVYVSASTGEGYSIGPREALALGKTLVLTDIPPHRELAAPPGVFLVEPSGRAPARYPEIDNRVFGSQAVFDSTRFAAELRRAREFVRSEEAFRSVRERKALASNFTLSYLERDYRRLLNPDAPRSATSPGSPFTRLPNEQPALMRRASGRHGSRIGERKVIVQSQDAGFFSLFNVFISHLAWSLQESSPPLVLPDWDAGRLLGRLDGAAVTSYCYSKPEDGNMWLGLFEPLYDLTAEELNDENFLYENAEVPRNLWNEQKEPLLTYKNAYLLYTSPWFSRFRRQYSATVRDMVRLRPAYQNEVDSFKQRLDGRFVVAAHVKHPSHGVEQPGGVIAQHHQYVNEVRSALGRRGVLESSDDWGVFLATDQERVVHLFEEEFGSHVIRFDDVTRISTDIDAKFDRLRPEEQAREGHQLQHLMAADDSSWSTRLAWEVWRDAEAMSASDVLIHAVSNVATAVSYLGERVDMVYCDPES